MKRIRLAPTAVALVCLLTHFSLGAADAGERTPHRIETRAREAAPDLAKENLKLRMEVELLKSRVARLEARVKELEAGKRADPNAPLRLLPPQVIPKPAPKAPGQANPRSPAQSRPLPEGWQEREHNGIKFYLVPLESADAKTGDAKPAAPTTVGPGLQVETPPARK